MPPSARRRIGSPLIAAAVAALTAGGGCQDGTSSGGGDPEVRSRVERITAPQVTATDALQLSADNRAFAASLYGALRTQPGNLVYAPASISVALAMLYAGANGTTATEIAQALHFNLPAMRLHPAFDALDLALTRAPGDDSAFRLTLVNAAWGQRDYPFLPAYLDTLAAYYGAGIRTVDFGAPEPARMQINQWVGENTGGQIDQLVPMGVINTRTRLVLTNAVYFKADWQMPFAPSSADGVFHAVTGDVNVPMMRGPEAVWLWSGAGFQAAALPYAGGTTSMVLIVPDAETFDTFEQSLTGESLGAILDGQSAAVLGPVSMPRFKFATKTDLVETLKALGMNQAFVGGLADLSGIDGGSSLFVTDVVHQATIAVDEKGTEAAAATAVVIGRKGVALNWLAVDRPFLFVIRDDATGAILFQGRVLDPRS